MATGPYDRGMSITRTQFRLAMLGSALGFVAVALGIRAVSPAGGWLEQSTGTALYAAMIYAGVLALAPRLTPGTAAAAALAWCWGAELFQLTGIPAALSAESPVARLVLGSAFDPIDLLWYPIGIVPMVVVHPALAARSLRRRGPTPPPVAERPPA